MYRQNPVVKMLLLAYFAAKWPQLMIVVINHLFIIFISVIIIIIIIIINIILTVMFIIIIVITIVITIAIIIIITIIVIISRRPFSQAPRLRGSAGTSRGTWTRSWV